jgi:hypothetical protein
MLAGVIIRGNSRLGVVLLVLIVRPEGGQHPSKRCKLKTHQRCMMEYFVRLPKMFVQLENRGHIAASIRRSHHVSLLLDNGNKVSHL